MFTRRLVLVALLGVLTAGCGHTQLLCPRQAGPAWRQYDSPHFAVTTDLSPARARSLVGEFERTYRSFVEVTGWNFPGRREPLGRMRVIVFSRRADYLAVGPPHTDGYYRSETLSAEAAVVIDNDGTHPPGEAFLHELTHRLVRYYAPNTPLGINEGLAEYFSTFTVRNGAALTGLPPGRVAFVAGVPMPNLDTLFNTESLDGWSPVQTNAFYLGAWFLVHTMARYYPQQLGGMLARLADGQSIREAYFDSFGRESWKELDAHYRAVAWKAYRVEPGRVVVPTWSKPYRQPTEVVSVTDERELSDGALHLLWADLQLGNHDIAAQVALAAAHGGDSAQLAYMRGLVHFEHKDPAAAERDFEAAVDARPDEERYHLTLARVRASTLESNPKQTLAAMAQEMEWLAANGQSADARAIVALYDAMLGDFSAARVQAQRAIDLDPTNARAYLALAVVAEHGGDFDGAIADVERALRLTPEGASRETAALRLLARLRAHRHEPLRLMPPTV